MTTTVLRPGRSHNDPAQLNPPDTQWRFSASHADAAIQVGHTDGGALVMSIYGHPSEDLARERLKRA